MRVAERRGVPLVRVGPDVVDAPGRYAADVVLVRPDQHIAWLGARPTPAEAESILKAVLHRALVDEPDPPTAARRAPSDLRTPDGRTP